MTKRILSMLLVLIVVSSLFVFVGCRSTEELKDGKYGIKAPEEGEEFETSLHPLCIVPCLAATKSGTRLGYGGGFYDRFLHKFDGISMCVQYDEFVTDIVPQEKRYDKKFDVLVTESGVCVIG